MTLVRFQSIMSNEIAKRAFFSRPPEPPPNILINDPFQAIYVGNTRIFKVPFSWSFANLTNPHIAVIGMTGAGKSYFIKSFLRRASYIWNSNAVILDWAGEYKPGVEQMRGKVISLAKGDYMNLLDLSGMKPLDRTKQIINSLDILTDISMYPEQKRLTEEAIEQAYTNAGFILYESPPADKEPPTLKEVIGLLQEKLQEGNYTYPAELENAIYRLRQFAREGEDFFAQKSTIDIGKLAESGIVDIDLSGLPDERFRALTALFILQTLKEKMRAEGWSGVKGVKTIIVLDEAWKVASDEKSDAVSILREGRKYQFGLIVASQRATDIHETILTNVGTTFLLRIKDETVMPYLQNSLKFSDHIRDEIGRFGVGEAAVRMEFTTAIEFPDTFIIGKISGEEPLYVYTIDMTDILTASELQSKLIQKEIEMEKDELRNKFIEYGVVLGSTGDIFSAFDTNQRKMKMLDFVKLLKDHGIANANIVELLRGLGMEDTIITRIIAHVGGDV